MTNYTKKAISGTVIVFCFSLLAALFSYFFRFLLAKNLSILEYGFVYSLVAFSGILMIFRDLGLGQAVYYYIPRFISDNRKDLVKSVISTILKIEIFVSLLLSILIILFSDFLITHYFKIGIAQYLIIFGVIFFFNSLESIFQQFFNAFQNQLLFSVHNFFRNFSIFILSFFSFFYFSGIYVALFSYLFSYILILIVFAILFIKIVFPDYFSIKYKRFNIYSLFKVGVPAAFSTFCFLIITYTDTLMLTYFGNMRDVGLYNAAVPLISLMLFFPISIATVILPLSSELTAKKKFESIKFAITKMTKFLLLFIIPVSGVLLIYPEICLTVLFGSEYVAASKVLQILAVGAILFGIALLNIQFIIGIIGPKSNVFITFLAAIVNFILNYFLIPKLNIVGAAIATTISYILLFILSLIILYRFVKVKFEFLTFFLTLVSGVIFILSIFYFKQIFELPFYLELPFVLILSLLIYFVLIFSTKLISIAELSEIKKQFFL